MKNDTVEEITHKILANMELVLNGKRLEASDIADIWETLKPTIQHILTQHHQELQKARAEERERIEAIFKEHVPPHAMDLEDSVWLKRLLNKAFNHDKIV